MGIIGFAVHMFKVTYHCFIVYLLVPIFNIRMQPSLSVKDYRNFKCHNSIAQGNLQNNFMQKKNKV